MSQVLRNTFSSPTAFRFVSTLAVLFGLSSCSGDTELLEKQLAAARAKTSQLEADLTDLKSKGASASKATSEPSAPAVAPAPSVPPVMPDIDPKLFKDETFLREQSLAFKAYEIRHTLNEMPGFGTIREVRFKAIERQDTGDPAHPENKDKPYRASFGYLIDLGQGRNMLLDFNITANTQSKWDSPTAEMVATRYREAKSQLDARLAQNAASGGVINPGNGGSPGFAERGDGTVVFSWTGSQAQQQAPQPQMAPPQLLTTQPQTGSPASQVMNQPSIQNAPPTSGPTVPAAVMPVQDTKIINFDRK